MDVFLDVQMRLLLTTIQMLLETMVLVIMVVMVLILHVMVVHGNQKLLGQLLIVTET